MTWLYWMACICQAGLRQHALQARSHGACSPVHVHGAQVAATCLYIYCRQEKKPYMLIDFSDHLSINVFQLGGVYLHVGASFSCHFHPPCPASSASLSASLSACVRQLTKHLQMRSCCACSASSHSPHTSKGKLDTRLPAPAAAARVPPGRLPGLHPAHRPLALPAPLRGPPGVWGQGQGGLGSDAQISQSRQQHGNQVLVPACSLVTWTGWARVRVRARARVKAGKDAR